LIEQSGKPDKALAVRHEVDISYFTEIKSRKVTLVAASLGVSDSISFKENVLINDQFASYVTFSAVCVACQDSFAHAQYRLL